MPRLSVLMPAKNSVTTIGSALKSALAALPGDSELLVWDDASSDGTATVAESLNDSRVKIFTSDRSVGSGVGRARLMEASDSEFIACMDADDVCLRWRFTTSMLPTPNEDIVFLSLVRMGSKVSNFRPPQPWPLNAVEAPIALLLHNPLAQPAMVARRSSLDAIGGYSQARLAQDYELWLRAAANGLSLRRSPVPGVIYRVSSTQISNSQNYREKFIQDTAIRHWYSVLYEQTLGNAYQLDCDDRKEVRLRLYQDIQPVLRNIRSPARHYYQSLLKRSEPLGLESP